MPRRWLFKTEPTEYSYDDLERDQKTVWDGVHNNLALKYLREVRLGDHVLIYHTGDEKALIGMAEAVSDAYNQIEEDDHSAVVNIKVKRRFGRPLPLAEIKAIEELSDFDLVRLPRLSVMPVTAAQWELLQDAIKA